MEKNAAPEIAWMLDRGAAPQSDDSSTDESVAEEDEFVAVEAVTGYTPGNAVFDLKSLLPFLEQNLSCRQCAEAGQASTVTFCHQSFGLAAKLSCTCTAGHECNLEPERADNKTVLPTGSPYKAALEKSEAGNTSLYNSVSLSVNHRLVLAMVHMGAGYTDCQSLLGLLGTDGSISWNVWKVLEEHLGAIQITTASAMVDANFERELQLSEKDSSNKPILVASFDMGWQKRSSGNQYNSLSGQAFLIGAHSAKVLAMAVKSKACAICAAAKREGIEAAEHECTKNHEGSSKAMESEAAVELIEYLCKEKHTALDVIVGDDDGTFRANIMHPVADLIAAGRKPKGYKRLNSKGNHRKCTGKLNIDVPEVKTMLADPTHRQKVFAKPLYKLANATKKENPFGWTKQDSEKMKSNFGYYIKMHRIGGKNCLPLPLFYERAKSVIRHPFNDHRFCGPWCKLSEHCPVEDRLTGEEAEERKKEYREMRHNAALFKRIEKLVGRFLQPDMLKECYHPYASQKNEAMNKKVSKFAPKDRTYCKTKREFVWQ